MRTLTGKVTFHKRSPKGNSVSFHKNKMIRAQSRKITVVNVMTIVFLEEIEKNIRFQLKMIRLDSVQDTMTVSVAKTSPVM